MKNIQQTEAIFILISCVLFMVFNYLESPEHVSRFSYLIVFAAYCIWKFVSYVYRKNIGEGGG